jgi:hypothetical protein
VHSALPDLPVPSTAFFVWIHMLARDNLEAARRAAGSLVDERVRHFHDPRRRVGKAFGRPLGSGGAVVWDSYMLFDRVTRWDDAPPPPAEWAHQLHAPWADRTRFRSAEALAAWLEGAIGGLPQP